MRNRSKISRRLFLTGLLFLELACSRPGPRLSALGIEPDWSSLENFQETVTAKEFQELLFSVFGYDDSWAKYFKIQNSFVQIKNKNQTEDFLPLRLASDPGEKRAPIRYWRRRPLKNPSPGKPLAGLRIALDPGHLGGSWARMEDRWFRPAGQDPVAEGDLTLLVARKLQTRLEALGAEVFLMRNTSEPVTPLRPKDFEAIAAEYLDLGQDLNIQSPSGFAALSREDQILHVSELLFYRVAEIRARAALINDKIRPDLTVCLHFNAGNWGNPEAPNFAASNHLHVLIPGAVEAGEWALEDVRFEMLRRMLDGSHEVERPLAEAIADGLARSTGLRPALVPGGSVKKIGDNPYLWSRNLLANRLYQNPTVFIEAYVMNYPEVVARLQAGDYSGTRRIGDQYFSSLFSDYADGVAEGILRYFQNPR